MVASEESGVRRLPIGEEGSVTRSEMVFGSGSGDSDAFVC